MVVVVVVVAVAVVVLVVGGKHVMATVATVLDSPSPRPAPLIDTNSASPDTSTAFTLAVLTSASSLLNGLQNAMTSSEEPHVSIARR